MKTMKKTVTALVLLAMLLSTCGIMASAFHLAVESEPVDIPISQAGGTVEPQRYERCEVCGTGRVNYAYTDYGPWCLSYYLDCPHGDPSVKDVYQEREKTKYFECSSCDYAYSQYCGKESRIVCKSKKG